MSKRTVAPKIEKKKVVITELFSMLLTPNPDGSARYPNLKHPLKTEQIISIGKGIVITQ